MFVSTRLMNIQIDRSEMYLFLHFDEVSYVLSRDRDEKMPTLSKLNKKFSYL